MGFVSDGALGAWRDWAEDGIRQYRMGRMRVRVLDPEGKPARGVPVSVLQKRHFFSFGTRLDPTMFRPGDLPEQQKPAEQRDDADGPPVSLIYQGLVKGLFNSASCGDALSWPVTSPEPDRADYDNVDHIADWCDEQRIELRGENLLQEHENGVPNWVRTLTPSELERALEERVRTVCSRYSGRIQEYDVNTGMIHGDVFKRPLGPGIVDKLFNWASESDPDASLYTSEGGVLNGRNVTHYDRLLEILASSGVPIHGIGCHGDFVADDLNLDLRTVWHVLDRLFRFGLPVKITDLRIVGLGVEPEAAAQFLADILTLAFGHPAVEGVSFRHLMAQTVGEFNGTSNDTMSGLDAGAAALFDATFRPLPAGRVFRELVFDRWWTRAKHRTGDDGCIDVLAFYGVHELQATLPGSNRTIKRHLTFDAAGIDGGLDEALFEFAATP